MRSSFYPAVAGVILSGVLWVIPSLGTQGMGTIGQRFAHADRDLVAEAAVSPDDASSASARTALLRADAAVESAVGL
jgi:hypothetical protein